MSFLSRIGAVFRPLDVSAAHAALDELDRSQRNVAVRARALRMDVSCGDPGVAIRRITGQVRSRAAGLLHSFYDPTATEPVPSDLRHLLDKM